MPAIAGWLDSPGDRASLGFALGPAMSEAAAQTILGSSDIVLVHEMRSTARIVAISCFDRVDPSAGRAHVRLCVDPSARRLGWPLLCLRAAAAELRSSHRIDNVFVEIPSYLASPPADRLRRLGLEHCGTRSDHQWHQGQYWDVATYRLALAA